MIFDSVKALFFLVILVYPLAYFAEAPPATKAGRADDLWSDLTSANPRFDETKPHQYPHCGFHVLLESYELAQPQMPDKIREYKLQTESKTYDVLLSPSGHFAINYELTGPHAIPSYDRDQNGTPDYLEFVATAFDRAWLVEIDTLGFNPPPDINGQAKETYEIICKNLSFGFYGSTVFYLDEEIASLPGNNYPSYIEISTDFSFVDYEGVTDPIVRDSMAIAVTAAHEFNHALQLGYNIWNSSQTTGGFEFIDLWYIESSATYMEEVVADQVNDYYQYLPDFFSTTDQGITYDSFSNYRIYGEVVLNIMAAGLYGRTITREVWEEILNQPALFALDKVFKSKGSSLVKEIQRLGEWMFFCGKYSIPGEYFAEASNYPQPKFYLSDNYNSGLQKIFEDELPPFSIQYLKTVVSSNSNLYIHLTPGNTHEMWSGAYFSFLQPYSYRFPSNVYWQIPFLSINTKDDTLFTMAVAGNWDDGNINSMIPYSLSLREFSGNPETDILVYPNIIKPEQGINYITFKNVPADARIEIFSGDGKHISTIATQFSDNTVFWNLKTSRGDFVGSGVYIYSIESSERSRRGKIVVIR